MAIIMQNKIKEVPGLLFVAESMELLSSAGRRRMLEQTFLTDPAALQREQDAVDAVRQRLDDASCASSLTLLRHQLMQLHDLHTTLASLQSHFLLSEVDLFEIKNIAFLCGKSRSALAAMRLESSFPLPDLQAVFDILDPDHTGIPNFYIYDSYDIRLAPLRRQMKQADDAQMTILMAEQNEIQQQVITSLCERLQPYSAALAQALERLSYIDFTLARAALAVRWGLHAPQTGSGWQGFKNLFNPRLRQCNETAGLRYQPLDIALTPGVTLVTGANMAGKTVLLKSVGVAQLMYQFGFPVPADEACLRPVDNVLFCIGDEQNEMNGLSSFAAEITHISDLLRLSETQNLMILIDEPARTTNPIEGKALVQALAAILQQRQSVTLITTHYSQLGIPCRRLRVRGFVESMVDMPLTPDNINRFIDYSLVDDDSDEVPQEALRIAQMLGCHPGLVAEARRRLCDGE